MKILENDNYKELFKPLTGKNRKFHYDCIKNLIELTYRNSLENPELYEIDAKDSLGELFKKNSIVLEDEDDVIFSGEATPYGKALQEIKYLRSKGWIEERAPGRTLEPLANVSYEAIKLVRAIDRAFDDSDNTTLSNLLTRIHETLNEINSDFWSPRRDKPYLFGYSPLFEAVTDLQRELHNFRINIRQIKGNVAKLENLEELNTFYLYDSDNLKILKDYEYITKGGKFPKFLNEILESLRKFADNVPLQEKIIQECMEIRGVDAAEAEDEIKCGMANMQNYFEYGYSKDVKRINEYLDEYISLINTRLHMLTEEESTLVKDLDSLLVALPTLNLSVQTEMLESVFDGVLRFSDHKALSVKSISAKLNRRRKSKSQSVPIAARKMSEEEKTAMKERAVQKFVSKYNTSSIATFFGKFVKGNEKKAFTGEEIKTSEDLMYLAKGFISSSSNPDFPYEITPNGSYIDNEHIYMSGIDVKRREKK